MGGDPEGSSGHGHSVRLSYLYDGVPDSGIQQPVVWTAYSTDPAHADSVPVLCGVLSP